MKSGWVDSAYAGIIRTLPLAIVLIGVGFMPAIPSAQEPPANIQITADTADQLDPDISGDLIVWVDSRSGNQDIYLHDLVAGSEQPVTTDSAEQNHPAINGNRIVWEDFRHASADDYSSEIYYCEYDPASRTCPEQRLTFDSANQQDPAIDGERIVWADSRSGNKDIYLYDLASGSEQQISADAFDELHPAISGDRIVWEQWHNGFQATYLYDLMTKTKRLIVGARTSLAISGDRIVWNDFRDFNDDIYLYDLATETGRPIATGAVNQAVPDIDGDRIVWYTWDRETIIPPGTYRMRFLDVFAYNLATEAEQRITDNAAEPVKPAISGRRIVWADQRNGNWDIYLAELPAATQTPWQTNASGTLRTDHRWNYALGYHFTPQVDGQVTQLGGFFNGTKTVKLFDRATGEELASAVVAAANTWGYTDISPVTVQAGKTYTVAVYLAGSGGSYRYNLNPPLPQTFGDIRIEGSTYAYTGSNPTARPTNTVTSHMYGQADIGFVPGTNTNRSPVLNAIGDRSVAEGFRLQFGVTATDPDGDAITLSARQANGAPVGDLGAIFLDLADGDGFFDWTPSHTQAGTYLVTFEAMDSGGLVDSETITITVTNTNRSPVLNPIGDRSVAEGFRLQFGVTATDPDGDAITLSARQANGAPVGDLGAIFLDLADGDGFFDWTPSHTQAGTYLVTFEAMDSGGLVDSETITITVGASESAQTPWQTNAYGPLRTGIPWDYNMGYHFVPQVNGKVTKLCGFFNGTKTVRLYDSSGSTLAFADVTASNAWGCTAVGPAAVTAGQAYTVAVYLAGSGASYRDLRADPLPKTFGNILITGSTYLAKAQTRPTNSVTSYMYGQADIVFVPD